MSFGENVDADEHGGAHEFDGVRLTHAGAAVEDDVARKLPRLFGGDARAGERTEAGVDSVDDAIRFINRVMNPFNFDSCGQ